MSFSDRTMTEPYTSREVSTVPGEGDANLLLQDSKAAAPYSTSVSSKDVLYSVHGTIMNFIVTRRGLGQARPNKITWKTRKSLRSEVPDGQNIFKN